MNRLCSQEYRVPGSDVILDKGTRVVGSILGIHRDPRFYKNPLEYDPDRFSEERKLEIKPGTYIPWGLGPKACIGKLLSLILIKCEKISQLNLDKINLIKTVTK